VTDWSRPAAPDGGDCFKCESKFKREIQKFAPWFACINSWHQRIRLTKSIRILHGQFTIFNGATQIQHNGFTWNAGKATERIPRDTALPKLDCQVFSMTRRKLLAWK